jgi:cyclic pyranopterin phosphate synthase
MITMRKKKFHTANSKIGMVDISHKDVTKRVAVATATITLSKKAFNQLINDQSPKGNVFETAKVAAIMAAKSTPHIIPLCHPLDLNKVNVTFESNPDKSSVSVFVETVCRGRTGVEMESLTAASAAVLTIYDMMKWADKSMIITDVMLLKKTGGKSRNYTRK